MVTQEILETFIHKTLAGSFVPMDPTEPDAIIGYYETKEEAEKAFVEYVEKEGIIFE
jgi:hypothetical protein